MARTDGLARRSKGDRVELLNHVNGRWCRATASEFLPVLDPATAGILGRVPLSSSSDVDEAVRRGTRAFEEWRNVPVTERVQFLFRLKRLLEENLEDLARTLTRECGKTLAEARGELRRGIENVETACGIPSLVQGANNEDIAPGVDEHLFRQPLGVVAAVTPFNFPAMIPLWFLPYAIACGNSFLLSNMLSDVFAGQEWLVAFWYCWLSGRRRSGEKIATCALIERKEGLEQEQGNGMAAEGDVACATLPCSLSNPPL